HSGYLQIGASGTNSGAYNISTGANLIFDAGARVLQTNSTVTGGGSLTFQGGNTMINGTCFAVLTVNNGSVKFAPGSSWTAASQTLAVNNGSLKFSPGATISQLTDTLSVKGGTLDLGTGASYALK